MIAATAKARLPQPIRASNEVPRVRAVFLDSSAQARMLDFEELAQLSRVEALVVLVSKSHAQIQNASNQFASNQIASQPAIRNAVAKAEVLKLPEMKLDQMRSPNSQSEFAFGDVRINFPEMTAHRKNKLVELTNMEFKTLKFLIQNPRVVISRDQLLNEVWGYDNYPCTRTVDNHILRLRQKFEREPSRPVHFVTVHGAGYKFLP